VATKCPKCHTHNPETVKFCGECGTQLVPAEGPSAFKTLTLETQPEGLARGAVFAERYEILEGLGTGGMGSVYRVYDRKLEEEVALKLIRPEIAASGTALERFKNELKVARKIAHTSVCKMYDLGESGGTSYITMEYVAGEDLKSVLHRMGTITMLKAVSIVRQVAEGLAEAHRLGVVHRDLKPGNIMIDRDGDAKIMDFGIARTLAGEGTTAEGVIIGTPEYMSPEQVEGKPADQRSDIYSLGIVLYEMLTGRVPFGGDTPLSIAVKQKSESPPSPKKLNPQISENLNTVILDCLEKDRDKRPRNAEDLLFRLRNIEADFAPPEKATKAEKSIAVLYLENMSPDKESDHFCAGITEDIITDLSKIKELKVVSRADVLPFRNKEVNTRQVGEVLGVNFILEGSVRKAGNKIRITGQLIDVRTGFHVWAERFDRLLEDIFDLQNEVSRKIAEALRVSLTESEKELLAQKPTEDLRAYDLYLRGRELLHRRGKKNNELAIKMFENALQIDPNFASAYAALAEADSYMYAWYDGDPNWLGKIIELNQKALSLEPDSADALFGIGMVYFYQKRYGDAKRTLEKVIQSKPDYYNAYRWLGFIADIRGEFQEALGFYDECAKIKPYSEEPWIHFYATHERMGNEAMAEQARNKVLELGERKIALNPDDAITLSRMAVVFAHRGEKEKAYAAIDKVLQIDPTDGLGRYNCACTYAVLGEREKALACLRKALESGYKNIHEWVKSDLDLVSLHEDHDFKALLAEFG
jgi:serine/threonine protein kinase/tetratricopeptide (TPR) repeat protein